MSNKYLCSYSIPGIIKLHFVHLMFILKPGSPWTYSESATTYKLQIPATIVIHNWTPFCGIHLFSNQCFCNLGLKSPNIQAKCPKTLSGMRENYLSLKRACTSFKFQKHPTASLPRSRRLQWGKLLWAFCFVFPEISFSFFNPNLVSAAVGWKWIFSHLFSGRWAHQSPQWLAGLFLKTLRKVHLRAGGNQGGAARASRPQLPAHSSGSHPTESSALCCLPLLLRSSI